MGIRLGKLQVLDGALATGFAAGVLAGALLCLLALALRRWYRARQRRLPRQLRLIDKASLCRYPPLPCDVLFGPFRDLELHLKMYHRGCRLLAQTAMTAFIGTCWLLDAAVPVRPADRVLARLRISMLVLDRFGYPVVAIDWPEEDSGADGEGRAQDAERRHAAARLVRAIKRRALRKANLPLIEVPADPKGFNLNQAVSAIIGG